MNYELPTVAAQPKTRYLVTMVHRATGQEQSLEVTPERESFAAISTVVRQRFSFEWEIFEWFDMDTPF